MKRIVSILQLLMLGGLFCGAAKAQGNDASKKIIDKLSQFETNYPAEKAYLQFDKPYYAAGDTIYFKAYVTAGGRHQLSNLSGVLHVELINTKNKIDQSIKLQLDSGVAWGDFALPDSLPAGNYRVRAYTQWMRNFGETGFFEKTIALGSANPQKIPESGTNQSATGLKPDVQFFPEGGSVVAGIASKVAFKVTGGNGMGIAAKGTIVDNDGREITKFESAHLGMGFFYLTPVDGKSYKAKISYTDGRTDITDLPKPETGGIILSVNNDSIPQASVQIAASADYFRQNRGRAYTLVISSPGSATTVNCKLDSPVIKLDILKRKLHTGVATVTLFSPENEPLAERLLFIQNYDQLNLNVSSDKNSYAKRDKVNIKLNALNRKGDPANGHFSVSVIDDSKVQEPDGNGDNILTNLLLTSDVKGYIEQPNYYFEDTSATARKNLDVLMLTQGYRRFEWRQVLDSTTRPVKFQLERDLTIEGRVENVFNKPVVKGTITLISIKGGPVSTTTTDSRGLFRFSNLAFIDTAHFVLSAVKANGKNSTQITWLKDTAGIAGTNPLRQQTTPGVSAAAMSGYVATDKLELTEVLNLKGRMLKQVNIKAKKTGDPYYTQSLAGAGHADQVLHADDLARGGGLLSTTLMGKLFGVHWKFFKGKEIPWENGASRPMTVIIDGGDGSLDDIPFSQVETVEVLRNASGAIYGTTDGVIVITMKAGASQTSSIASIGVLPISPMGFYKARIFYSPKYANAESLNTRPDLRSTIYWNPEIRSDKDGNAGFDFYNADGVGTYKVTVEGIDKDGNLGRQVYRYTVQ
jgi:hypothetical protein